MPLSCSLLTNHTYTRSLCASSLLSLSLPLSRHSFTFASPSFPSAAMLSSTLLVLGVQALTSGVAALAFDWVDGLPSCWRNCLKDAGCNSQKCICESSANSNAFLPSAVSCAASKCDADDWALDLALLGPLGLFCSAIDCDIPDEIMSSAQVAATATAAPQSTAKPTSKPKTSKHDDDDNNVQLQTTVTKTLTHTTTDDQGHTLQVIVPIVMGPKTLSTGKMVTSTLQDESPSSTQAPSSAVAIPTDDAPAPTQAPQAPVATTAAPTQKSNSNAKGNGSPFENMQAGAQQWIFSVPMISLGLVAGLFMRL